MYEAQAADTDAQAPDTDVHTHTHTHTHTPEIGGSPNDLCDVTIAQLQKLTPLEGLDI